MSRITIVLFHLVLTASVTVWANSGRQLALDGQETYEDQVVSEETLLPVSDELLKSDGASASIPATSPDQGSALAPSI